MNIIKHFKSLFKQSKKTRHIWMETHRVNLGSFVDFRRSHLEIQTMYRIAVFETCLITGKKSVTEISDLFPCQETKTESQPNLI